MSQIAGALIGGGLSAAGGLLGGLSANRAQQKAIDAQKEQYGQNNLTLYQILQSLGIGGDFATPGAKAKLAEIDALEQRLGPNITAAQKQQLDYQRRNALYHGVLYHGATPDLSGSSFGALRGEIGKERDSQLGEYDRISGLLDALTPEARAQLLGTLGNVRGASDALVSDAGNFGQLGRQAAQTAHDRSIEAGRASIRRSETSRGVRSGSRGDNAEIALRGQAAGGLAQALADVEGRAAQLRQSALGSRLNSETNIANRLAGFDLGELARRQSMLGGRLGTFSDFGNRSLGTFQNQTNLASSLINPQYAYQNVNYPSSIGGNVGMGLGGALGALGSNLLGQSLYGLGQQGGGGGGGSSPYQSVPQTPQYPSYQYRGFGSFGGGF